MLNAKKMLKKVLRLIKDFLSLLLIGNFLNSQLSAQFCFIFIVMQNK